MFRPSCLQGMGRCPREMKDESKETGDRRDVCAVGGQVPTRAAPAHGQAQESGRRPVQAHFHRNDKKPLFRAQMLIKAGAIIPEAAWNCG